LRTAVALLLVSLPLSASSKPPFKPPFKPPCKLPFASIAKKQAIDAKCGLSGLTSNKPTLAAQDLAKDNFCATGTPVVLTFAAYLPLQAAAEKVLGGPGYQPPDTRKVLQHLFDWNGTTIGEGTLVALVAYPEAAHYSDVESGESVNCDLESDSNNDIHIPLVSQPGEDECTSVTAEISPHDRPAVWTADNVNKPKVPMRFTGQLLFDAEHHPCVGTKVEEPKRQSVWEIHPVYAIDVCTAADASQCDPKNAKVWKPLDQWLK